MTRPVVFCVLIQTAVAGVDEPRGAAPEAVYTAPEIKQRLRLVDERIRSIQLSYRAVGYGAEFPQGTYLLRSIAAAEPDLFYHHSAHGHAALDPRDDFLQQCTRVIAGQWYTEQPLNRIYFTGELEEGDPLPGTMPLEIYFLATGVWPLRERDCPQSGGHLWMLRDIANSDDFNTVREFQEQIDGRWCHVISSTGGDALWLDADRNWAVMAREIHDGGAVNVFRLQEFREVIPGVWLPARIWSTDSPPGAVTTDGGADMRLDVINLQVNSVDRRLFRFAPPAGALLLRSGSQAPLQTVPGGTDHLDKLAMRVRAYLPGSRDDHRRPSLGSMLGLLLAVSVICWTESLRLLRRWRRRSGGATAV